MLSRKVHRFVASSLIVAMVVVTSPVFAAPPAATLTGTVYANDVATPLAGATVVVTDANGTKFASQPTAADGTFTVAAVAPGRAALALQTKDGAFAVATPVTLAPGETKGVYLALKGKAAASDDDKDNKKGAGPMWTGGEIAAMTAVLVGFAAAAWVGYDQTNDDDNPASAYTPPPSN